MNNLYDQMLISLALYEGDDPPVNAATVRIAGSDVDPATGVAPTSPGAPPVAGAVEKVFTQADVNGFLAEDRRKHQTKHAELEAQHTQLQASLESASQNQNLTQDQRDGFKNQLEDLQKTFRSKEQQLVHERTELEEKYEEQVKDLQESATSWEGRFRESTIERSLSDAARDDSFRPEQVVALLRPMTQIIAEVNEATGEATGRLVPMVDLEDIDTKTGEQIITRRTPADAVKRMKELPELWGNLFRSNVVSGIGSGSATGSGMPGSGVVDPKSMPVEQYMKLRQENPAALGLK